MKKVNFKMRPTRDDKGLTSTLEITFHDNGNIDINGSPCMGSNDGSNDEVQVCNAIETLAGIVKVMCEAREKRAYDAEYAGDTELPHIRKGKIRKVVDFFEQHRSITYEQARKIVGWGTIPLPGILRDAGHTIYADPAPHTKGVVWRARNSA